MTQRRLMIRSIEFEPEGAESRMPRRTSRNSRIENRMRVLPIVEANIKFNGLNRDVRLNVRDKNASFLICWDPDISKPELIVSPEGIDKFVMERIESLRKGVERARALNTHRIRLGSNSRNIEQENTAIIGTLKDNLGIIKDGNSSWKKRETKLTHVLNLPTKFKIAKTEHAILSIGKDGLTVTPLTEQEGWVKMISPKEYNFTFDVKPGESAMVKFGFKW